MWIDLRKNELTLDQALVRIALSRKKWELPYLNRSSHFNNWHSGLKISESRSLPLPLELNQILNSVQTPAEAYGLYFDIRKDKTLRPMLLEFATELAERTKNARLKTFMNFKPSSSYEFMVLLELLIDLYDIEAKERHQAPKPVELFIPMEQRYYNDIHVSTGKALLRAKFWQAYSSRNFQFGDLDLRFSGSLFSCLWRERCFQQKGSMKTPLNEDWTWTDIVISDGEYNKALELEEHYYSKFVHGLKESAPTLSNNS